MRNDLKRKIHETVRRFASDKGKLGSDAQLSVLKLLLEVQEQFGKHTRKEAEVEFYLAFQDAGITQRLF